jgi:hypothetical protein
MWCSVHGVSVLVLFHTKGGFAWAFVKTRGWVWANALGL